MNFNSKEKYSKIAQMKDRESVCQKQLPTQPLIAKEECSNVRSDLVEVSTFHPLPSGFPISEGHRDLSDLTLETQPGPSHCSGVTHTTAPHEQGSCGSSISTVNTIEDDSSGFIPVVKRKRKPLHKSFRTTNITSIPSAQVALETIVEPKTSQTIEHLSCTERGSIPPSELYTEVSYAYQRYQRRHLGPSTDPTSLSNKQYNTVVEEIRSMRSQGRSPIAEIKILEKLKKKRKKLKQRAICQSADSGSTSCPLLDGLQALIAHFKTAKDIVGGEQALHFLVDLSTVLYNIYRTPDWNSFLFNGTSFLTRYFPTGYVEYAIEWLKSAFSVAFTQDTSSTRERVMGIFNASVDFLNDNLWSNIQDFFVRIAALQAAFSDAVSFEALDMDTILAQFRVFKASVPEVRDIVDLAFQAYLFVHGKWEQIITGEWTKLLLGKDETMAFEMEVRRLEQAFPSVLAGKEIELMDTYKMTRAAFDSRMSEAIRKANNMVHQCTSTQQRMAISNFIRSLTDKQSQLYDAISDAPRKDEAYALKLAGPSGTGKSQLLGLLAKVILHAYSLDPNEKGLVVFTNIAEKFESTVFPSHKLIAADDVANNANEKPNYDRILNYVNTVPRPLEKADTKEKGRYYPGNDAFIATTNDETLRAMECSSCPESILRRFALDVTVNIRSKFKNKYGGLVKTAMRYDVYELELKRFSHIEEDEDGRPHVCWDIIPREEWNEFDDDTHDFPALCKFLAQDVRKHVVEQEEKRKAQEELDGAFCTDCGVPGFLCTCKKQDVVTKCDCCSMEKCKCDRLDSENGDHTWCGICHDPEQTALSDQADQILSDISDMSDDEEFTDAVAEVQFGSIWSTFSTVELWDIRSALRGSPNVVFNMYRRGSLWGKMYKYRFQMSATACRMVGSMIVGCFFSQKLAQALLFTQILWAVILYQRMLKEIDDEIRSRRDQLSSVCTRVSDHLRTNMLTYFKFGAAFCALYEAYKLVQKTFVPQDKSSYYEKGTALFSNIMDTPRDVRHRVVIQDERDYKEGYSRMTPKETAISKTTTSEDLQYAVSKALRVVIVQSKGVVLSSVNGILVASNVIMVPSHVIPDVFPFDVETSTMPGIPSAKTKDQKVTREFCYIDRELDIAFIHLASSPAGSDFSMFFPEEYPQFYSKATTLLWKGPDNTIFRSQQAVRQLEADQDYYGKIEKDGRVYGTRSVSVQYVLRKGKGLKANLEFPGFGGLCGGLYLDSRRGIIYGMHVAGFPTTNTGFITCVTQGVIKKGLDYLKVNSPTLVVHSAGEIKVDTYGLPYTLVNSPPNYLRDDGNQGKAIATYFGKVHKEGVPLESNARPPYIPTPFKGIVEAFGERRHRPPTKPNDLGKGMKTLNKLTNPVQHYEGDLLLRAVADYTEQTIKVVQDNPEEIQDILRLYTQEEAMDGIGEAGLGGTPNSTSAGHPINKPKKDCLVRDPMDESLVKIPREFNDKYDIQAEIDRTLKCWETGTRSETIYKASSKVNELLPNAKAKEKVRKFYGSSYANFVASRRVLGGVARFMRKFWRETECLVGINPTSREWEEFHDFLTEYSSTNLIAGDFAGFDTRMAAQITGAAAKIIYTWYKEAGCSLQELSMVAGALSDIIHPNIIFDGDLYRFANGVPSGNLITVQLNSICNSIMMRYVYYAIFPSVKEKFSQNIKLGTFGDDNAMSVKPHCKWFNHTACQEEFAKLDISYTMTDKDAKSVPYIPIEEVSFLKRFFRKHDSLDKLVAPIELDSTYKKFHWVKKPTESPLSFEEQFGAYTDGAFRDMYLRGRHAYEEFLIKIQGIIQLNPTLKQQVSIIPYDEMTKVLEVTYRDDYVNDNKKLFAESCGLAVEDLEEEV